MPIGSFPPYEPSLLSYVVTAGHTSGEHVQITIGRNGFVVYDEAAADALAQGLLDMLAADPNYTWVNGTKMISDLGAEITPTP